MILENSNVEYIDSNSMKINEVLDEKIQQPQLPPLPAIGSNNTSDKNNQSDVFTGDEIKVTTFIGPNAKADWNPNELRKAEAAVRRGESREDIWLKHGTLWAADRLPRQEISNHKDKIINRISRGDSMRLGDFLHAPEVFKNYPQLANAIVTHDTNMDKGIDAYAIGTDEIGVGPNPSLVNMMHEVQHLVDMSERHSAGQSMDRARNIADQEGGRVTPGDVYSGSTGERSAVETGNRQPLTPDQRRRLFPDKLDTRKPNNKSYIHVNQRDAYGYYEILPLSTGRYAPQTKTKPTKTKPKTTPRKQPQKKTWTSTGGTHIGAGTGTINWKANENK